MLAPNFSYRFLKGSPIGKRRSFSKIQRGWPGDSAVNYLLDTCALSEFVKKQPPLGVLKWISEQPEENLFISVISIGEIEKGIYSLKKSDTRHARLKNWLETRVISRFRSRLIPLDLEIFREWGRCSGNRILKGNSAPVLDGLLAATARCRQLQVVTRHEVDFADWEVETYNPWIR